MTNSAIFSASSVPARLPFARLSRVLAILALVLAPCLVVLISKEWLPCVLSADLAILLLALLAITATTFHVLSKRGQPLTWGTVLVRILLVLCALSYGVGFAVVQYNNSKAGRSVAYSLFPGGLSYKAESCFETQLALGFDWDEEIKYGFNLYNHISNLKSAEGAHRLLELMRERHVRFDLSDVAQALRAESDVVLDSVLVLTPLEVANEIDEEYLQANELIGTHALPRLRAWMHWRVADLTAQSYKVLAEQFLALGADSLKVNLQFFREGEDWVLDLRPLGAIADLPEEFAWIPAHRVLLADGALKAANDELTAQWASKVSNWSGPNAELVALRGILQELYAPLPQVESIAQIENDQVVALRFTAPVSEPNLKERSGVSIYLGDLPHLRELSFNGTGVARNGGLIFYGQEGLQVLRLRNENLQALSVNSNEQLQEIEASKIGLSSLYLSEDFSGKANVAGNHLCATRVRERLEKIAGVVGMDQQDCAGRPSQWDSLFAEIESSWEDSNTLDTNVASQKIDMKTPNPVDAPLWTEALYYNEETDDVAKRIFYPGLVRDDNDIIFGEDFPPQQGGKLLAGMTLAEAVAALGTPYRESESFASWKTGEGCEGSWEGLRIGFNPGGKIRWVQFDEPDGCYY